MGQHQDGLRLRAPVISVVIGLTFLGAPHFIREGTIINAILIGQYVKLYFFLHKKLFARKPALQVLDQRVEPSDPDPQVGAG